MADTRETGPAEPEPPAAPDQQAQPATGSSFGNEDAQEILMYMG